MSSEDFKQNLIQRLVTISHEIANLEQERQDLKFRLAEFEAAAAERSTEAAPKTLQRWSTQSEHSDFDRQLAETAKQVFGIHKFRPLQLPVMRSVLNGFDTVAVLPTGSGKSLLYQLPALALNGLTLVISPLRSLMRDQTQQLQAVGVKAEFLAAGQERSHATAVYAAMLGNKATARTGGAKREREGSSAAPPSGASQADGQQLKILFVTPERIAKSKLLKSKLEAAHKAQLLKLIVVDEVHCVSQWGHDFRPDFKQLSVLKTQFRSVPCLGLTATASGKVLKDVQNMLQLQDCQVFRSSVRRPNLFLEVQRKAPSAEGVADQVAAVVQQAQGGAGIVYCLSRKDAESTTAALLQAGVAAGCYHAWLSDEQREAVHDAWSAGHLQVICATVAFGMGINMLRVRFVVHHSLPKSIEGYSQEAGRAGRDGQPARCVLLYRAGDVFRQSIMAYSEKHGLQKLYAMAKYAQAAVNHSPPSPPSASTGAASAAAPVKPTPHTSVSVDVACKGRHARLAAAFGEAPHRDCPFGDAGLDEGGFPLWCGCDLLVGPAAGSRDVSHLAAYLGVGVLCVVKGVASEDLSAKDGVLAQCVFSQTASSSSSAPNHAQSAAAPGLTLKQLLTEFHKWDRGQAKGGFKLAQLEEEWRGVQGGVATPATQATTAGSHSGRVGLALDGALWEEVVVFLLLHGVLQEQFSWTAYSTISYLNIGSVAQLRRLCSGQLPVVVACDPPKGVPTDAAFKEWSSQWGSRGGDAWSDSQVAMQASPAPCNDDCEARQPPASLHAQSSGNAAAAVEDQATSGAGSSAGRHVVDLLSSDSEEDWA